MVETRMSSSRMGGRAEASRMQAFSIAGSLDSLHSPNACTVQPFHDGMELPKLGALDMAADFTCQRCSAANFQALLRRSCDVKRSSSCSTRCLPTSSCATVSLAPNSEEERRRVQGNCDQLTHWWQNHCPSRSLDPRKLCMESLGASPPRGR